MTINDEPHQVIGVMPRSFKDPFNNAELWRALPNAGGENAVANTRFWGVLGLVRPGVSPATIDAELGTIAARFAQNDPQFYRGWDFTSSPLRHEVVGDFAQGLLLVVCASFLVRLITCANVPGLQLVRASTRQREVAIRLALGASRGAIMREQLTESLILVFFGGIGGVLVQGVHRGVFDGFWRSHLSPHVLRLEFFARPSLRRRTARPEFDKPSGH